MTMTASPRVEIIAVGSELLTPNYQDTNSLELTRRLNSIGLTVSFKSIVGDESKTLARCLLDASARADLIFIMGGLGPTRDDNTRETLAEVFHLDLEVREDVLKDIRLRFQRRGVRMPEVNLRQARVPKGADVLTNRHGTAPGLWLNLEGRDFILLPGPPREIIPMFESEVMPRLRRRRRGFQRRRVLKIAGLTESGVEDKIKDLYPNEPGLSLTILASPGQIELHLTSLSPDSAEAAESRLDRLSGQFEARLGEHIFSCLGEELEETVGRLLRRREATLAVAESCTGGLLGHRITDVPGSSAYFLEGVQAYSNSAKISRLNVPTEIIETRGAVSPETAEYMARGVMDISGADFGLSITGIAGPDGGSPEKPVGLVYTALACWKGTRVEENRFPGGRKIVKRRASQQALDMLRRHLLHRPDPPDASAGKK